ncbi:hypothetical protein QR90_12285 [Deinococcus radiopugnans]|uniref:Uncharacterized protein n=2 Tax=Deinococcus radiopugnans TaxID=57497 RepID=A0A0A7KHM0_9DEIO|nr:hypothetical protein [Deinococcus radiopugnans]AIZ45682.1 hypothetical protein QR90_12285 [Deinococcus radiopugnans]MBB6016988.1 hypothetical protein [Deinococcus radiopugnans ATCC 19172]QLG11440.1 hypothetical protein HLB42_12115 [Deinococcus sp. D7000]TNM71531.1 hypothetical protein FHR04_08285 [Deinococcus radiopugnans ATCC 19172]
MSNRSISNFLTIAGLSSILASIAIWATQGGTDKTHEEKSHGERFGIFVGLWAPTFFVLANKYNEAAVQEGE